MEEKRDLKLESLGAFTAELLYETRDEKAWGKFLPCSVWDVRPREGQYDASEGHTNDQTVISKTLEEMHKLPDLPNDQRPFNNPVFWAAFVLYGQM